MKIIWSEFSLFALSQIHSYIAEDSLSAADSFIDQIIDQPEKLLDFPKIGRVVPEIGQDLIRELIFKNYRIIYSIESQKINILTVIHGSQNLVSHIKSFLENI